MQLGLPGTGSWEAKEDVVCMCEKWYDYMQPGWCQPVRQEFMENECEALPGVAYPGVPDNRSTVNTKTGYDDDDEGHSVERMYLRQRCSDGSVNKTILKPRLTAAAGRQYIYWDFIYVGFSRRKIPRL